VRLSGAKTSDSVPDKDNNTKTVDNETKKHPDFEGSIVLDITGERREHLSMFGCSLILPSALPTYADDATEWAHFDLGNRPSSFYIYRYDSSIDL
jgi:hypothetical protein